jgi:hypothetical protein
MNSFPVQLIVLQCYSCKVYVKTRVVDPYSYPDLDSMGSLDPYPDSQSGSGSRRAKMTHKHRKKLINFIFEVLDDLFWGLMASSVA